MNLLKKSVSLLLLISMLALPLASCKGGEDDGSATAEPAASSAPEELTTEAPTEPATEPPTEPAETEIVLTPRETGKSIRVLFIGNSYTYYNDMNQPNGIFASIAKNAGYPKIIVNSIYKGSYYLHKFLDPSDTYGKQVLDLLNSNFKYDIVIIQEQSAQPIANPSDFYASCRKFKELIDKNGAEMWLYATWGYKTGHSNLSKYGPTTQDMEMKLRAAYTKIGEELGVPVIYAGAAMTKAFEQCPSIEVYRTDFTHPTEAGSYLVAWTIFGTVFGVDPATLTYNGTLPQSAADKLRSIASDVVRNGAPVDEKYRK